MFDMGNAAFAQTDQFEPDYGHQPAIFAEAGADRDDFSVSRIELGTRLISREMKFVPELIRANLDQGAHVLRVYKDSVRRSFVRQASLEGRRRYFPATPTLKGIKVEPLAEDLPQQEAASRTITPAYDRYFETQAVLRLDGDFSPSHRLVEFWVRGVASYRPANIGRTPTETGKVNPQIQAEFSKLLLSILGMVGQQRRYSRERSAPLTIGGRFSTLLQIEFCDRFQIVPDESRDFLRMLADELRSAVSDGARITGAWGSIVLDDSQDLTFMLQEAVFASADGFVKSEDVE